MRTRYLRALIAVLFITGVASATFFISTRLSTSQKVAPNAPESEPQAFTGGLINRPQLYDEDIRQNQTYTPPKSAVSPKPKGERDDAPSTTSKTPTSTPIIGRSDEKGYSPSLSPTKTSSPNQPATTPTIAENRFGYRPPDTTNVPEYMKPEIINAKTVLDLFLVLYVSPTPPQEKLKEE